ncbi:hypothetical protein AL512_032990 [Pseudomonas aeruginosa]|nr:hypothetical protein AL512_032990 [Pseudomonas aeruginosa]
MEDVAPAPAVGEFGVASCGVLLASVVGVIFGPTGLVISSFSLSSSRSPPTWTGTAASRRCR